MTFLNICFCVPAGSRIGSAAHRYSEQLHNIMKAHWDIVQTYITTMSAYGIRKGNATTMSPPVASIQARGDWSIGKVLDANWKFAEVGDSYLGRCLCGLDPDSSTFSVLPPHWMVYNPVEDTNIQEALQLMYSVVIIAKHLSSIAVLVRVLASVVYAADWLLATSARHHGHPFSAVPLLQNPKLLLRLKAKVTIEPTVSMLNATGVPPHVKQLTLMKNIVDLCQTALDKVTDHATVVRRTIFDALEECPTENGQISHRQIMSILDDFRKSINDDAQEQLEAIRQSQTGLLPLLNGGGVGDGAAGTVVQPRWQSRYSIFGWRQILGCARHICISCKSEERCGLETLASRHARLRSRGQEWNY